MRYRRYAALTLLLAIADYAVAKPISPFIIKLQQLGDGRCLLTVRDRVFDIKDKAVLDSALSSQKNPRPPVHILGDTDTPYRCIGSLIYVLQRKGYNKIGFISEMPDSDPASDEN